jgi:predicted dehydrogenase
MKLKLGVIGAGGIAGGIHLPVLAAEPDVELRAVCDLAAGKAEEAAKKFGIGRTYLSYHEMLEKEELDAVFVLVEPDALFRAASNCLLAGKHVFMEKPMGITAFQAKSLVETATAQRRVLHVGYNRRYIPLVREMTRRFREITSLKHIDGRFYKNSSPSFYGGCASSFICDVIHVIDLVRHIAAGGGGDVALKRASTLERKNQQTGIAEAWYVSLEFDNGVTASIRANYRAGGRVHEFELHGEGASAFIDLGWGGPGCSGKILQNLGAGSHSLSAAGADQREITAFDGLAIAASDRYEIYYGYREEDRLFIQTVLENPNGNDGARLAEDYASMELAERLLAARIPEASLC